MSNSDRVDDVSSSALVAGCGGTDQADVDGTGAATTLLRLANDDDGNGGGGGLVTAGALLSTRGGFGHVEVEGFRHASATSSRRRTAQIHIHWYTNTSSCRL